MEHKTKIVTLIFLFLFSCVFFMHGQGEEYPISYQSQDLVPLWTVSNGNMPINNPEKLQLEPRVNRITYAFPAFNHPIETVSWEVTFQIQEKYGKNFRAGLGLAEMKLNSPKPAFEVGITEDNIIKVNPIGYSPKMTFRVPEKSEIKISIRKEEKVYRITVNNQGFSFVPIIHGQISLCPIIYTQSCSTIFKDMNLTCIKKEQKVTYKIAEPTPIKPTIEKTEEENITSLPRIRLEEINGKKVFVRGDKNEICVPRGFNHVVLEHRDSGWHALFNTNVYKPDEIENVLKQMAECGGNVIRIWAWGTQNEFGFLSDKPNPILNIEYMNNFIDFLRKATKYNIYVIPILDEYPKWGNFKSILTALHAQSENDDPHVTGYNRQFFWKSFIQAKAMAIQYFIQYIKDTDPTLLSTVLAWSLQNEVFVMNSEGPFSTLSAEIQLPNGTQGKVSTQEERQKVYDQIVVYWANELTKSVKSIDPDVLVTVGMWTSDSAGRKPTNGLLFDGKDARFPPRPSVLGGSECLLDFIDIHIYPWDNTSKVNRECHEYGLVKKPVIVGEYGVFQNVSIEQAKTMLIEFLQQAYELGYVGDLYWVWDLTAIPEQTYSAVTEGLANYVMHWDGWKKYFTR